MPSTLHSGHILIAASLWLAACTSPDDTTPDGSSSTTSAAPDTDPSTSSGSTATSTSTSDTTGEPDPTGGQTDTGGACPDNPCSGSDAAGVCDGTSAITCVLDEKGCRVPGETTACPDSCMLGVCCGVLEDVSCDCVSNPCLDNNLAEGWHCVDNQEVYCSYFDCLQPFNGTPVECGENTCEPATGTCGGCKPDNCYTERAGTKLCGTADPNEITGATCALVDGCMRETMLEVCDEYCAYGEGCAQP